MTTVDFRAPYPYVDCSDAELLSDAEQIWKRLLDDIAGCRKQLMVENFIFSPGLAGDAITDAMVRASNNGAKVRLMVDAYGSSAFDDNMRSRLKDADIDLKTYNPSGLRDLFGRGSRALPRTHRRLILCDQDSGWVGGMAFDDQWWPQSPRPTARDTMLRFTGGALAHLEDCFNRLWNGVGGGPKLRYVTEPRDEQLRLIPQYAFRRPNYRRSFHWHLHASRRRVWIAVPYFIPGPRLMADLRIVAQRGIDLRLLFPGPLNDHPTVRLAARRYYGRLLRAGARVYEYQPSFMHAKISLFDDDYLMVGSANLDRWSMFINNELVAACRSKRLALEAETQMKKDFEQSEEIRLLDWDKRPLRQRILERAFGLFDRAF
ncbi:MAG: hypothetical protein COB96_00835 [Planctomycetota bacterium]|nr:MAG: hypothetical protein COB96_00835 [Planctomycetota bacterium]